MRYLRRGLSKVYWLTTEPADLDAPTVAEIAAGDNITTEIQDLVNFEVLTENILLAGHSVPFLSAVRGRSFPQGDPEINFWDRPDVLTERTLLSRGKVGWLVLSPDGDAASTLRCEVWPLEAHGAANGWKVELAGARWSTKFSVSARPSTDGTIAA